MTDPELGKQDENGSGDNIDEKSHLDEDLNNKTVAVDLDDSKAHLINANGGAGSDHMDVRIIDGTAASSDGEVSFNGLGKDEVMKYADEPFWKRLRWVLFILFWIGWFAMLITAVIIIAMAPRCPPRPDLKWYQKETVYQVLPETFKDSNEDGHGDFAGLQSKMGYIGDLGAKVVWMSDIFKTDGSELGIIDHMETSDYFDTTNVKLAKWMKELEKEGKKVVLDLVPNQSSKNHTWFKKSQAGDEVFKDFYVWHEGTSATPPNNWKNLEDGRTDGSAWTWDDTRGAWYYHKFGSDYPDLNLANDKVVTEIKKIMRYWFDQGVAGFHIKDVQYLVENPEFAEETGAPGEHTKDYEGTFKVLEELRKVADEYSQKPGRERFLFGTLYDVNKTVTQKYWGEKTEDGMKRRLHIALPLMYNGNIDFNAKEVQKMVENRIYDEQGEWIGLGLGNQYTDRIASRLTSDKLIPAFTLELLLPGTPFNFYGDEFGQKNNAKGIAGSPMQWNGGDNAGFSGRQPYIDVGDDYKTVNAKAGKAHFTDLTTIKAFKSLVKLRSDAGADEINDPESFQWGKTRVCAPNKDLFLFSRKATRFPFFAVLMNLGSGEQTVDLSSVDCVDTKQMGEVVFHASDSSQVGNVLDVHAVPANLKAGDVVVMKFEADEE